MMTVNDIELLFNAKNGFKFQSGMSYFFTLRQLKLGQLYIAYIVIHSLIAITEIIHQNKFEMRFILVFNC